MTILIAGDSWGCGEWSTSGPVQILHKGLEQYLLDDGLDVVNLSKGGISNLDSVNRIATWVDSFPESQVEKIFVFQTEFDRDFKHYPLFQTAAASDLDRPTVDNLSSQWITRFYSSLSNIAQKHKCKVYLIGGASDTMYFDDMEKHYPGCNIACQSMTNLILENTAFIHSPVYSWFSSRSEPLMKKLKDSSTVEKLLEHVNRAINRRSTILEHPEFFYPDGTHPNRQGHKILFDFLKETNII